MCIRDRSYTCRAKRGKTHSGGENCLHVHVFLHPKYVPDQMLDNATRHLGDVSRTHRVLESLISYNKHRENCRQGYSFTKWLQNIFFQISSTWSFERSIDVVCQVSIYNVLNYKSCSMHITCLIIYTECVAYINVMSVSEYGSLCVLGGGGGCCCFFPIFFKKRKNFYFA